MISVYFLAGVERAYAAAMASDPDLSQPWQPAHVSFGLSAGDLAELQARVDEVPGAWWVEPHQDCDGERSAMLMPWGEDEAAPTFVLRRAAGRVLVEVCRGDSYACLGSYGTIARAVRGVVRALARAGARLNQ